MGQQLFLCSYIVDVIRGTGLKVLTHRLFRDIGRDHDNSDKRKLPMDFVNQRK